ncbi:MAG: peptide transporter substrate-binding protein [Schumannella sp.]|jgi:peptide/nickel transport system substrate-binding protein|nr:peptide transporter substrate-binding protein [Schumannella sp.]
MVSISNKAGARLGLVAVVTAAGLVLAGCAGGGGNGNGNSGAGIIIGTTDKVTKLDPAGSFDNGSLMLQTQVFGLLMDSPVGTSDVEPSLAKTAEFTTPNDFTVTIDPGLKFANGDELTSSDIKFSFDRQTAIADENGPSYLLGNIESIDATDDTTVVFHLKNGNDQTFAQVLSTAAGAIVDEEVFSADAVTTDDDIVAGNAFSGQYVLKSYDFNNLVTFASNDNYTGVLKPAATSDITLKYYTDASNLKLDVQEGNIDVAWRTLDATDIGDLRNNDKVTVTDGPGGEMRYIVFNFNTMPYGAKTPDADAAKALAVRVAAADLIDRQEISDQVYKGTHTPLYGFVVDGLTGAIPVLKDLYGDGNGGPDADKAKQVLTDAGVTTPVVLNLQYNTDHYGEASADEYALIKSQLEATGLFTVNLASTEYTQYSPDRTSDVYPAYELGWYPDFSDADNYLTPFFGADSFLVNHYSNPDVISKIAAEATESDPTKREALIQDIQKLVAADLPTIPVWQGAQVVVTGTDVKGAQLDGSFKFRFGELSK